MTNVGAFHTHDGWYFQRGEHGEVIISLTAGGTTVRHVVDSDTWCSIVAHVSPHGDCSEAFTYVEQLHSAGLPDVPRVGRQ